MKVKIYYHHTDCGGVVYYANYLEFLEEARSEYFVQAGFPVKEQVAKGILFVVARQEVDYEYPAFYGDILEIKTKTGKVTGVRIEFLHEIYNQDGRLLVNARTILVCVDSKLKPAAIPEELRSKIPRK